MLLVFILNDGVVAAVGRVHEAVLICCNGESVILVPLFVGSDSRRRVVDDDEDDDWLRPTSCRQARVAIDSSL